MPAPVRAMIAAPGLTALRPRAVVSRNPLPGGSTWQPISTRWPNTFGPSPLGWENGSIGGFLDAAATWGEDSRDGLPGYSRPENAWRRAAQLMLAGKFYE